MTETSKKLGENIKKLRVQKGMNQLELCRVLGVDTAYISNVENGKKNPTLKTVDKIAKVLKVDVNELLK
ncbi:helix-turn-helix transcriptional regulator [Candidatus Woesearchaeota archaeon]|jgi:transcriptional regulator with XRE-family HTH domain|nr:helix-turn-helix transcriptional regulator [Candidatus Woesearchaeota archaeon]